MDILYFYLTQYKTAAAGAVLAMALVLFFLLRKKIAKIVIAAAAVLLLCGILLTQGEKGVPVKEDPVDTARTEYQYPYTSNDAVELVMERFLRRHTGSDAKFFVQEFTVSDWRYIYRDVFTDCAYISIYESNVLRIIDNTDGVKPAQIRRRVDQFLKNHPAQETEERQKKIVKDFLSKLAGTAEEVETCLYYNGEDDRFYDLLRYVAVDEGGAYFADTVLTPVP